LKINFLHISITCFWVILASCSKPLDVHTPEQSYNYFPLKVGEERQYEIIRYNYAVGLKEKIDTIYVKEKVTEKEEKNNTVTYQIVRSKRGIKELFFTPEITYKYIYSPENVINTENNQNIVQLKFPLYVGAKWNINAVNRADIKEANIVYTSEIPKDLITNNNIYKVEIEDKQTQIDYIKLYDLYAKNIGLIYTEDTHIEYCQEESCIGKFEISSGYKTYKRLLQYIPPKN
jgi:hypothetical protein